MQNCFKGSLATMVFLTTLLLAMSCQKSQSDLNPDVDSEKIVHTEETNLKFGPNPPLPCFQNAEVITDLAVDISFPQNTANNITPPVFTNFFGTLDAGGSSGCGTLFPSCQTFSGEFEVIYFGTHPSFANTIDPCALFCYPAGGVEISVDPEVQQTIYNRAVALAMANRPNCPLGSQELMDLSRLDFYLAYDFATDLRVIEVAAAYCCD